jgi:hypothetical protein
MPKVKAVPGGMHTATHVRDVSMEQARHAMQKMGA